MNGSGTPVTITLPAANWRTSGGTPAMVARTAWPGAIGPTPAGVPVDPVVAERNLRTRVEPEYPEAARVARVQGTVKMSVTIGASPTSP